MSSHQSLGLRAALRYAEMGWAVFPLIGKKPAIKDGRGCLDATTDEMQITAWWQQFPNANIGAASGLKWWVLDVDTKSGGDYALEELEEKHKKLPATIQQITGTGGKHYLFALPDFEVHNSQSHIAPGLDVRGKGGYIVVPPSVHPDTGRQYIWDGAKELHEQAILAAPAWLIDLLRPQVTGKTKHACPIPTKIPKGQQHSVLVSLAGTLRQRGLEFDEIFGSLKLFNESRCTEPGPINNIRQIAESVCKYPAGSIHIRQQAEEESLTLPIIEQLDLAIPKLTKPSEASELIPLLAQISITKREVYIEKIRETLKEPLRILAFTKAIREEIIRLRSVAQGWQSQMVRTKEGALAACIENVRLFLSNAPEWAGVVGYNEFTGTHTVLRNENPTTFHAGQEIEDHYDTQVICWLERRHLFTNPATVGRVIDSVAREHAYHPVRHYLESLPAWDGRPRIGSWLLEYCGAEAEDEDMYHYIATIGEKFLISAVARIFEPGCKVDHLLILEGTQGIGKSTVPRILAGDEWFTDQLADLGHKQDASMALRGRWMIEFGELDVIGRAEMTRVNAFLTQQTDRYRPPYGRHMVEFPRQCVFIGTTNQDAWSRDETGARRFWPVRCGIIDTQGLMRDREQLWAEAIRQYRAGVKWWLEGRDLLREAVNQQEGRYLGDPWQVRVIEHAENLADCVISGSRANSASISEILDKLGIRVGDQDQRMANRVARCLLFAKWVRRRTGSRGDREWRYFRPDMGRAMGVVV